jgi:hypothetical protein
VTALGLTAHNRRDDDAEITEGLVGILQPLADSFEVIGVDSDRLFSHIRLARSL